MCECEGGAGRWGQAKLQDAGKLMWKRSDLRQAAIERQSADETSDSDESSEDGAWDKE